MRVGLDGRVSSRAWVVQTGQCNITERWLCGWITLFTRSHKDVSFMYHV